MTAASDLIGFLGGAPPCGTVHVSGWRFEIAESESLRFGIRDSELGGPYEGPASALRLGGVLELHWSDGVLSRAALDRRAVLDPAGQLEAWRSAAFAGRKGKLPPLAGPSMLPPVETCDPLVVEAVRDEPARLLDLLASVRQTAHAAGAHRTDAVLRAGFGVRTVASSRGFRANWQETSVGLDLWVDELGGGRYERRALPEPARLTRLTGDAVALAGQLQQADPLPAAARGVLLMPSAVDALLGQFLLPNLMYRAILDGRSVFSLADLRAQRQIARDDFDLVVDTTLPLELATAPCSHEGVPAGRAALMERGQLVSPIVTLEDADGLEYPPTPRPRGHPRALLLSSRPPLDLEDALALLDVGLIVRELPGLHTQASRRASYALVLPEAQTVIGGKRAGRCAVRLAGNLIDHVLQPTTCAVRIPGEHNIGLLVLDGVGLVPA